MKSLLFVLVSAFFPFTVLLSQVGPVGSHPCQSVRLPNDMLVFEPLELKAHASTLPGIPSCGKYSGLEDWYSVVIPASGVLSVELEALELTDVSMEAYTGDCQQLEKIKCLTSSECNSSDMPVWFFEQLVPGSILYIRIWDDGGKGGRIRIRVSNPYGNPYQKFGDAKSILFPGQSNCIEMTSNDFNEKGCAWYPIRADFNLPFTYEYSVFLGTTDADGADGMCIVFQPNSPSECGSAGGGIGAQGIRNSWIVEMDTWRNWEYRDPVQDHVGISINGNMSHQGFPPVTVPNLEDGRFHRIVVSWEPSAMNFRVVLDGVEIIAVKYDVVGRIFNNNPLAYWGITASTGGSKNQHVLCFENISVVNREPQSTIVKEQICQGDSIFLANAYRASDGVYIDSLKNRGGCDSLVLHELVVTPLDTILQDTAICQGNQWQGRDKGGIYVDRIQSPISCDQILVTSLSILPVYRTNKKLSACDSLFWDTEGKTYFSSGIFQADLKTAQGCDSIVTLDLTIHQPATANLEISTCDSLFWEETQQWLTKSGPYQRLLKTYQGCDSLRTLQLTLHSSVVLSETATACDNFIWNENNVKYTASGLYKANYQTIHGCDSVRILNLDVHNSTRKDTLVRACDQFTWNQTGLNYPQSGTYETMYKSIYGCDSVVSLVLTISPSFTQEEQLSVCDSIRWQRNNAVLTRSGLFQAPYQSQQGCDSTYILTLEVHPSYDLSIPVRSCDTYLWEETGEIFSASGSYSRELTTRKGCDSLRTLHLVLDSTTSRMDTVYARGSYYWPQSGETYTQDGIYTNILTASTGCDSIQSLVLKLLGVTYPNILHTGGESNNRFTIYGSSLVREIEELVIFDRWGNRVFWKNQFPPNEVESGWDGLFEGQPVAQGVYVFTARLMLEGFPPETMSGSITVIK